MAPGKARSQTREQSTGADTNKTSRFPTQRHALVSVLDEGNGLGVSPSNPTCGKTREPEPQLCTIAANRLQLQLLDFFHHLCLTQKLPVVAAGSSWTRVSLRSSGMCDLHWLGHLELLQYREEKTQESGRHRVFHPHHRLSSISLTPSQQRYFFPFLFPFLS